MDKVGKLHLADQGIDNMTDLVELSDHSLLSNLQTRYNQKLIYTYIGSILISINPYTELGIYEGKQIRAYQNKSMQDMPPHLFGIGEINYSKMILENENQVIVISGESGAGKTESFKRLLKYFAYVSGGFKEPRQADDQSSNDVAAKILDSTPLLESFGNAQTIRNDNSSRFGKYVEIFFESGKICGSRITNYLLEKSRIVHINPLERGYHIFYEVLQGLDSLSKSQYYFKNIKDYNYLNQSQNFIIKDRNDANSLTEFMKQWSSLGLTTDDMDVTMRVLSAVLHLGNIKFMEEQEMSFLKETENIGIVAKVLKIDSDSLKHCLTTKITETVKDASSSPLNVEQSINYRDTLAKHLYSELFNWIVGKVNESLNQNNPLLKRRASVLDQSLISSSSNLRCIAMLDIYGFENFPENSLEQLCINYANETLQQFFNKYVFELEQAEYKQEGIDWHYITYPDNQPIIDLLSLKPNGVIQILNDECAIPQGSDEAFLTKCHNVHSKNPKYEKPKKVHPPNFIIHHFAGSISYSVTGFLEKNRDILRKEVLLLIESSEVEEISDIFRKKRELQSKNPIAKARTPAVMGDFQNSLTTLLTKMKTCQPWFIRCLKPNTTKEALKFNKEIVMDQMKYTGILETVKIRKSGFPIRILFNVFLSRFYLLVNKEIRRASKNDQQEACLKLMLRFKGERKKHFEIGKSKLFLKENFARHLEKQVQIIRNRSAMIIQRNWRAYWKIKQIIIQNNAATKIQSVIRGFLARRRIKKVHIGIIKLQSYVRMQLIRRKFLSEHPNFLKYNVNKKIPEKDTTDSSRLTAYKIQKPPQETKQKKNKTKKIGNQFNYDLLKIPVELALLLDKAAGNYGNDHCMPSTENIVQTGRAQHLWNRGEYKLPENIDYFVLENLLDDYYNNIPFESKLRPINAPYLLQNDSQEHKEDALITHKLIMRVLYAKKMPWGHRYLTICYLLSMGMKTVDLQREIFIQILAEALPKKSSKNKLRSDNEEERLTKAWTLFGDLLSYVFPTPDIYDFILKCVSDCVGVDQAVTCQEKLLHCISSGYPCIPRIYPVSNLEHRANQKGAKTCLKVTHPDDYSNAIHLNSFTTAESLASHSLCFRVKRYKLMKGWSVSVVFEDRIYDCGGQHYVLDLIAGFELPQCWSEFSGQSLEYNFLTSRRHMRDDTRDFQPRGIMKKIDKASSSKAAIGSIHSMDSWVDKNFATSFRQEDQQNFPVQNFIHGLEDELRASNPGFRIIRPGNTSATNSNPYLNAPENHNPSLMFDYQSFPNPAISAPNLYYPETTNDISMLEDPTFLEERLQAVELENKVIKSSIEREILQSRLQKIQAHKQMQKNKPASNVPSPIYPNQYPVGAGMTQYPVNQFGLPNMTYYPVNQPLVNPYISRSQFLPTNPMYPYTDSYHQNQHFPVHRSESPNFVPQSNKKTKVRIVYQPDEVKQPEVDVTKLPPPTLPPPPPPPHTPPSQSKNSFDPQSYSTMKPSEQNNLENRQTNITKYSDVGDPSNIVVDDSTILPTIITEEKKSYKRAAEVPKVNISNRAAFLETFFKDKPISMTDSGAPRKRKAPLPPSSESGFPDDQKNAINLLASMNNSTKIIPRPSIKTTPAPKPRESIHKKTEDFDEVEYSKGLKRGSGSQLPRINVDDERRLSELNSSKSQIDSYQKSKPPPKRGKYVSNHKAIILCGLPDMKYYTYQKTNWFLLLKREIYLPNEVQGTAMLNPMVFCQIVRDLMEFPCIRWVGNEKQRLISMLGRNVKTDVNSLNSVSSELMLQVINEAQKCELYFSRFYPIHWVSSSDITGACYWIAISHTGIRIVLQTFRSRDARLDISDQIEFRNVLYVRAEERDIYSNPQLLIIETKSRKIFKMKTVHAASIQMLIEEFLNQIEIDKTHGTINLAPSENLYSDNVRKKRNPIPENLAFSDSGTMMLGVNNERIVVKPKEPSAPSHIDSYSVIKKQGNLIDFVLQNSKHKNRKHVENVVMRWQQEHLTDPILPFLNAEVARQSLGIFSTLLLLSKDVSYEENVSPVAQAKNIVETIYNNKELNEEVILQIFKQINGNSDTTGRRNLWNILSIILIFIGPSKRMETYLHEHLSQISKNSNNQDQHFAVFGMKYCKTTRKNGPRKEKPSEEEYINIMAGARDKQVFVKVSNETVPVNVEYNGTVEEVVKMVCEKLGVNSKIEIVEYSIAYVETVMKSNGSTYMINYLKRESYLLDELKLSKKPKDTDSSLYFTRMSWIAPLNLEGRSRNFIDFTFHLISKNILNGDWLLPSTDQSSSANELSNIAKIAYFSMRGQGLTKLKGEDSLKLLLPQKLLDQKKKTIPRKDILKFLHSEIDNTSNKRDSDEANFRRRFLELIEKVPRYGCIKFMIEYPQQSTYQGKNFINFQCNKIYFTDEESQQTTTEFNLTELVSFSKTVENQRRSLFTVIYRGNKEIKFYSAETAEITIMLNLYKTFKSFR